MISRQYQSAVGSLGHRRRRWLNPASAGWRIGKAIVLTSIARRDYIFVARKLKFMALARRPYSIVNE